MNCNEFRDLAELLRDGALGADEAAAARAHLASCAACREFEEETGALLAPLGGLPPGPWLPPPPPRPRWLPGAGTAGLLLLGVLVAAGSAALLLPRGGGEAAGEGPPAAAPASVEAPGAGGPAGPVPPGADPAPAAAPEGSAALSGRLLAADPSPALPGARVTVDGASTLADAAGVFTLRGLRPGGAREVRVEVPGGPPLVLVAPPLEPGTVTVLEAIAAGPALPAAFRVVDAAARPVPGARVRAWRIPASLFPEPDPALLEAAGGPPPAAAEAAADAGGTARFPALGPGEWTLLAEAPGFARSRPLRARLPLPGDGPAATLLLEPAAALEVRVLDAADDRPVAGAEVAWTRAAESNRRGDFLSSGSARAGPDGVARLEGVPDDVLAVAARRPGAPFFAAARYADPARVPSLALRLPPEGTLRGLAVDGATGGPAAGAALRVECTLPGLGPGAGGTARVTADDRGAFSLGRLPAGGLVSVLPVRGSDWLPEGSFPEVRAMVRIRAGNGGEAIRVPLRRAGALEGRARGKDGAPGAGADVAVHAGALPGGDPVLVGLARADAEGRYRVGGLPPGDVGLPGGATAAVEPGRTRTVDVEARWSRAIPSRHLRPAIRGVVAGPGGPPPAGARLLVSRGGTPDPAALLPGGFRVPVAPDGSFAVELPDEPDPLPPEPPSYLLVASSPGCPAVPVAVTMPRGGAAVEGIRLAMAEGRVLEGRALHADGAPAAGLPVEVRSPDRQGISLPAAVTGPDGSFRFEGLDDGPRILVFGEDPRRAAAAGPFLPGGDPVEARLPRVADLRGRLRAPDGSPVPGAVVTWTARDASLGRLAATTGPDGTFRFAAVPRVPCRVATGAADPGEDPGSFVQAAARPDPGEDAVEIVTGPGASVAGVVEGAGEGEVVRVLFRVGGEPFLRVARTGPGGAFEVAGLPPGVHRVEAGAGPEAAAAEAEAGSRGVRIAAAPRSSVSGTVRLPDGSPAGGAVVRALPPGGPPTGAPVLAGEDGRFVLPCPAGPPLSLEARTPSGAAAFADGVAPGTGDLTLRVGAGGTLAGRVVDAAGAPAGGVRVRALSIPGGGPAPEVEVHGDLVLDPKDPFSVAARWTVTGPDGAFDLGSPAGRWFLFAGEPGGDPAPAGSAAWDAGDPRSLELPVGRGWALVARAAPGDAPGAARPAAADLLLDGLLPPGAPRVRLRVPVRPDGTLEAAGLPPGPVTVVLRSAEGREAGRARVPQASPGSPPVEVPPAR